MKLSVFTDEISRSSSARAISLAAAWGVSHIEVRGLDGGRFPRVDDSELADFESRFRDAGLAVAGVSPGLFKCPVSDPAVEGEIAELLPRACEWARRWNTELVSCFAFRREAGQTRVPDEVGDRLGSMCEVAAAAGCRMMLENEAGCWGGTGRDTVAIIRRVGGGRLGLCWDPGNSARAGARDVYPHEYEELRDAPEGSPIAHVHLKNHVASTGSWALLDGPDIDWSAHLKALRDDGYRGFIVVETHTDALSEPFGLLDPGLEPLESNTLRNIEYVRSCL